MGTWEGVGHRTGVSAAEQAREAAGEGPRSWASRPQGQDPERGPAVPPPALRLSPASTTAAPTVMGPVLGNKPSAGA